MNVEMIQVKKIGKNMVNQISCRNIEGQLLCLKINLETKFFNSERLQMLMLRSPCAQIIEIEFTGLASNWECKLYIVFYCWRI